MGPVQLFEFFRGQSNRLVFLDFVKDAFVAWENMTKNTHFPLKNFMRSLKNFFCNIVAFEGVLTYSPL